MTSREALQLEDIPPTLLVVGGGYIGMELGTVYATLGSQVVVVEALDSILMGADADLVRPVQNYAKKHFREVRVKTKVLNMSTSGKQIKVLMEVNGQQVQELYDRVLVAVGRTPNCSHVGLENTKVTRDEKALFKSMPGNKPRTPQFTPLATWSAALLAHKAAKKARIAVEVITGGSSAFENIVIPAVVFTDGTGLVRLTETGPGKGRSSTGGQFPWTASGRALSFVARMV